MKPKVVILCGGKGTRLREETENKPKPMVTIGRHPILFHIMKHYSYYGYNSFVLCLGYKGESIKDYFLNYVNRYFDFQLNFKDGLKSVIKEQDGLDNWEIIFADTGLETNTGGRIKRVEKYIEGEYFFLTYGDGLSNVNLKDLEKFFLQKGKIGLVTGTRPESRFGKIDVDSDSIITGFKEKPLINDYINGGFFVFNRKIFDYLDENSVLEKEILVNLSREKELVLFKHDGFWKCMDTYKDYQELNEMWENGDTPWKVE